MSDLLDGILAIFRIREEAATAIEELQREVARWRASFDGHVYVANEEYAAIWKRAAAAEALLAGERELLIALNKRWSDATTLLARQAPVVEAARPVVDCWGVGRLNITELGIWIDALRTALAALDQGAVCKDSLQGAEAIGQGVDELEKLRADAARYNYLKEHCSYYHGEGYDPPSPRELGIQWGFQDNTPARPSMDDVIDKDIARHASRQAGKR